MAKKPNTESDVSVAEAISTRDLRLRVASAQLAILLVHGDDEQSLMTRLKTQERIEEDDDDRFVNTYLVLTETEREVLPHATFVIDSIQKAIAIDTLLAIQQISDETVLRHTQS